MFYSKKTAPSRRPPSCRQRQLVAGRDGFRQAQQDQGGKCPLALQLNRLRRHCSIRRGAGRGIEPDFLWECVGDGEFSFSDFANEYFGHVARRSKRLRCCWPCIQRPSISIAKAKAAFRKAPPTFSQALWPVLKKASASADHRAHGRRTQGFFAAARVPPLLDQLLYKPTATASRPRHSRRPVQRNRSVGGAPAAKCGAIRRRTTTTCSASCSSSFPRGTAFPAVEPPPCRPACRAPMCGPSRSTMRRPPRSTTPFRCRRCPARLAHRHPHRGAGAGHRAGIAARRHRARKAVDRLHARQQDHHAARRAWSNASRWPRRDCPAISLYLTVTPELEITATNRASKWCRSSPTCATTTSSRCSTSRRSAMACPTSLCGRAADLWQLANACEGRRGKPSAMQGNTTTTFHRWRPRRCRGLSGRDQPNASAAARSTSWSPN
jgi:exoribonuclease-2